MAAVKKSAKPGAVSGQKRKAVNFGKFHEYVCIGDVEQAHELTRKEEELLIADFRKARAIEKKEEAELKAVRHFEQKLQELIANVVYLEGYMQQIEEGNSMLKINPSVKELGAKLTKNMGEVEELSRSILHEEQRVMGLAKHVKKILAKARKYHGLIFG